jgi:hypothetical protein
MCCFTSDHGDRAGAHELNQKHRLYDESARVRLILAGPGPAAGTVVDTPVSPIHVLPTACDLVTRNHTYVVREWGEYREQLFDRAADPGEHVNLAVEARYRPLLAECRRVLRAWSTATGDRFAARYVHREESRTREGARQRTVSCPSHAAERAGSRIATATGGAYPTPAGSRSSSA